MTDAEQAGVTSNDRDCWQAVVVYLPSMIAGRLASTLGLVCGYVALAGCSGAPTQTVTTVIVTQAASPAPASTTVAPVATAPSAGVVAGSDQAAPKLVRVPDVDGEPLAEAMASLRDVGFRVRYVEVKSTEGRNMVVGREPQATHLPAGSLITLWVPSTDDRANRGTFPIPNVVGQPRYAAARALEDLGLVVGIEHEPTRAMAPDTVMRQSPQRGEGEPGMRVVITVAAPDRPSPTTTVLLPGPRATGTMPRATETITQSVTVEPVPTATGTGKR